MEIVQLEKGAKKAVRKASDVLRLGGVIIYPTDTLYGLGTDALSDEAVAKVYAIKGRNEGKPMHAVFADLEMVEEYAEINDAAIKLAERFLPGPLTLILKKRSHVMSGIAKGIDTIGIRIPDNALCLELARSLGKPYTTTSANRAGDMPQMSIGRILEQLGKNADMIDLIVDGGALPESKPTTVVNVVSGNAVVLREGAIPTADIFG